MLIGISGKKKTGKTTVAKALQQDLGSAEIFSFGDPLKDEASAKYQFPRSWCDTEIGKDKIIHNDDLLDLTGSNQSTVREVLQAYGTDCVRKEDSFYWIKSIDKYIRNSSADYKIIADMRFENEAGYVDVNNGLLIRIEPYEGYESYDSHWSETALDHFQHFHCIIKPDYGKLDAWAKGLSELIKNI